MDAYVDGCHATWISTGQPDGRRAEKADDDLHRRWQWAHDAPPVAQAGDSNR